MLQNFFVVNFNYFVFWKNNCLFYPSLNDWSILHGLKPGQREHDGLWLRGVNLRERGGSLLHAKYTNKRSSSLFGSQWIATGYALAMTILEESDRWNASFSHTLMSLREERQSDAAIHWMQSTLKKKTVQIQIHIESSPITLLQWQSVWRGGKAQNPEWEV